MSSYWINVFTLPTWEEAQADGCKVTGFSESRRTTVARVRPGDVFLCYLKGASKLVGALQATGESYFAREPRIWTSQEFPVRVPVDPLVILTPDTALDFRLLVPQLSFYAIGNAKRTYAHLQGSPTLLSQADGEFLLKALQDVGLAQGLPVPLQPSATPIEPLSRNATGEPSALPRPMVLQDPLDAIIAEVTAAQRDAAKPARLEQAVTEAFRYLGFDVEHHGQAGRPDIVLDSPLGYDRFRAVIDAKASSSGKVPDSQITWPALADHAKQVSADHIVVVGERFAGGNLHKYAADFSTALLDTESLFEVLRLHRATPFSAADLRPLFATAGPLPAVVADLRQKAQATQRHWQLVAEILQLADRFSRAEPPLMTTPGHLHAVLVDRAINEKSAPPSAQDVREAMDFLASRAVGVLRVVDPDTAGYRLTMSVMTALQRLGALRESIRGLSKGASAPALQNRVL